MGSLDNMNGKAVSLNWREMGDPWTKWMRRNVVFRHARPQAQVQGPGPRADSNSDSTARSSTSRHRRQIQHHGERGTQDADLVPLLSEDEKFYLIGQKLSSMLSEDQQTRLLRDALRAGKRPPATAARAWVRPDIESLTTAEIDLVQAHRLVTTTTTQPVVNRNSSNHAPIAPYQHQKTLHREKSLPGLPSILTAADIILDPNTHLHPPNLLVYTPTQINHTGITTTPALPQELNTARQFCELRFPKIGVETYLHCAICHNDHPSRLFSITQRRAPAARRKCIGREGYVRLCAHKVVTWGLVEACLGSPDDMDTDGVQFKCEHPSHVKELESHRDSSECTRGGVPEVVIWDSGRVVLQWSTHLPITTTTTTTTGSGSGSESQSGPSTRSNSSHRDGAPKNVICPSELGTTLDMDLFEQTGCHSATELTGLPQHGLAVTVLPCDMEADCSEIKHQLAIDAVDMDQGEEQLEEDGLGVVKKKSKNTNRMNPSRDWFAAIHPDSYNLDKWANEGLFGLRWCGKPECKSYLARPRGRIHRPCETWCL
ncbi:hypothetical protein B0T22DRAFT_435341 [Podospora appendiculata]|uniref:Uncharacterized protein n=1 Tax=Podospora appendiculata TaxID=314037 RepID=A0AAE1CEV6_9PEZI|nr:hypothetical protein B0T22DRAFT_435341 [Podospora appendiculata]